MTVAQAIRAAAERLADISDTARLDAELLMAHALQMSRSDMLIRAMRNDVPSGYAHLIDRRAAYEPVAYITGQQEFYGRSFKVAPGVLIPRPDSETVVQAALSACPNPARVLDLGTGSGALLLSVLAERPGAFGVGIDACDAAIEIARANAMAQNRECDLAIHRRDWREGGWADDLGRFDLILCNPPYVETGAALDRDVRDFEPASALFAGDDGLDDYRLLIPQLHQLMRETGVAIFEIGATQSLSVCEIAEMAGFAVEMRRDLANRPRVLIFRT